MNDERRGVLEEARRISADHNRSLKRAIWAPTAYPSDSKATLRGFPDASPISGGSWTCWA